MQTQRAASHRDLPRRDLRVHDLTWEADDVVSIGLTDPSGAALPTWAPGAHIDLQLPDGIERQYSLCSDPRDSSHWRVAVLREEHGRCSRFVHDGLRVGTPVRARGPINTFTFDSADRYVFIAAGIGITPILPMLRAAECAGVPWRMAYLGRERSRMAFRDDPVMHGSNVDLVVSGERGRLSLAHWLENIGAETSVYACGPRGLLDDLEKLAVGWPAGTLRIERFEPVAPVVPANGDTILVECKRSGVSVTVPADRSILEVLEDAGLDVPSSCRQGTCGTCETPLIDGIAEHRDAILTPEERAANDTMMVCVSRARTGALVLDI